MAITRWVSDRNEFVDGKYTKVQDGYFETIAVGRTYEVGTQTVQIMSDIWGTEKFARFWNDATGKPEFVSLDICDYQFAHGDKVHAEVDITPEAKEALIAWKTQLEFEALVGTAEQDALKFEKGAIAEVVKGRSGKGSKGKVVVVMTANYNMGWQSSQRIKLGIATSDVTFKKALPNGKVVDAHQDMVWAWAMNCKRLDVKPVDKAPLLQAARERAVRFFK